MITQRLGLIDPMLGNGIVCKIEPKLATTPDQGRLLEFCICDYTCNFEELALYDVNNQADGYKNDKSSFFTQAAADTSTITFVLRNVKTSEETILNGNNTLGEFFDIGSFESSPLSTGYIVDWLKVFQNLTYGVYEVDIKEDVFGQETVSTSHRYKVIAYSERIANQTVKIESVLSACYLDSLDYTGVNWPVSIRIPGEFAGVNIEYESTDYQDQGRSYRDSFSKMRNTYNFQSELVPWSIAEKLLYVMFMANDLTISDYNLFNVRIYDKFPIKTDSANELVEPRGTNKLIINWTFRDRQDNIVAFD